MNQAAAKTAAQLDSTRMDTLAEAQAAGLKVPAFETNPSALNNTLGSVGGKAAVKQQFTLDNQEAVNALAAKSIGLPTDRPITPEAIGAVRGQANQAYAAVGALSPQAAQDLEALKQARFDANAQMKFYSRSADPTALKAAQKAGNVADALEARVETHARAYDNWVAAGKPQGSSDSDWFKAESDMAINPAPNGLVENLRNARTLIAKTHVVEGALNEADGNISAPAIGKLYANGAPLTGDFGDHWQVPAGVPALCWHGIDYAGPGSLCAQSDSGRRCGLWRAECIAQQWLRSERLLRVSLGLRLGASSPQTPIRRAFFPA